MGKYSKVAQKLLKQLVQSAAKCAKIQHTCNLGVSQYNSISASGAVL